jgi:riboflavin kinase/FMN adenylyltransferase
VLTFYPHPAAVLHGQSEGAYLTLPQQKAEILISLGVELVVVHPFDDEVRHVRAADFVDSLLSNLNMVELWVGEDFALGYQREGNVPFLQAQAAAKGFTLRVVDFYADVAGERVSSTSVRRALATGDVDVAARLMGRTYRLMGTVVAGAKRGRTIGIPTANLLPPMELAVPQRGVYAAWVSVAGGSHQAVVNIGLRPTFDGPPGLMIEAHLLDYSGDLYDQQIGIDFVKRLRDERRFEGVAQLVEQIHSDIAQARRLLDLSGVLPR